MALKYVIKNRVGSYVETTPEEDAQKAIDEQREIDLKAIRNAEIARLDTFFNNLDRQEFLDELKTRTASEVETFVRTRIDAGSVTNNQSAQACLSRIETALVRIMQLLAYNVKR